MATRLYLPSTGTAAVSPAFDAGWDNTDDAVRRPTSTVKAGSTMTTIQYRDNSNKNENHLIRQYVSGGIDAQTIAAQAIKFQARWLEDNANDDQFATIGIRVVSSDGSTVRGTILAVTRDDVEMSSTALTNRQFTATSSSVSAQAGDRIVIEIGTGGDPTGGNSHNVDYRVGDVAASDLAEDDTSTTDNNPWVEFANTITFFGPQVSVSDTVTVTDTPNIVKAERLWQTGFELNSETANMEFTNGFGGVVSIQSSIVRTGTYAGRALNTGSEARFESRFSSNDSGLSNRGLYQRIYLRIATAPSAITSVLAFVTPGGAIKSRVRLATDRTLELWDGSAKIGSSSSALALNTWYRVELYYKDQTYTTNSAHAARLDGTEFASSTSSATTGGVSYIQAGNINNVTTVDLYFDDWAINSEAAGWPGAGAIKILRPSAAGDNAVWTRGGTDSGSNWGQVDETPPNDVTDYVLSNTSGQIDDYNVTDLGLSSGDSVKWVTVNVRRANNTADATTAFVARIKKTTSGTVFESTPVVPNSTTWRTGIANGASNNTMRPMIIRSTDPDGALWTNTTIDSMQIGVRESTSGTNNILISAIWAYVDYVETQDKSVSVSDTVTVTDTPTIRLISNVSKSDTVTVTDTPTIRRVSYISVSDTVTFTDTPTIQRVSNVSKSDTVTVTDTPTIRRVSHPSVSDTVTVTDTPTIMEVSHVSVSDTITVTDGPTIEQAYNVSVSDSITVSDTPTIRIVSNVNVSDSVTVTDFPYYYPDDIKVVEAVTISIQAAASDLSVSVADTITVTDSPTLEIVSNVVVSDTITVTDAPTLEIVSYINVSDEITVTDAPTLSLVSYIDVSDEVTLSDSATLSSVSNVVASDEVTITDSPTVLINYLVPSVSDTVTVTDSPTLEIVSYVSVSDEITLSESVTAEVVLTANVSDTITITDTPTVFIPTLTISVSDSVTVSDAPTLEVVSYINVSDAITVTDTPTLSFPGTNVSVSDVVTVTDSPTISILVTLSVSVSDEITVSESTAFFFDQYNISVSDAITVDEHICVRANTAWINESKNSTTWTNETPNSTSWTNESKSTTNWDKC